ncbi:hypothetical protein GFS24_03195 [Chitinophaga sp. SYP-B3965]|uniref:HNH endonuclease n=1 Tax=Chitinophaga sp. SYP-B3965 TaxID=2663120 RepID=UPI001299C5CF|nr:HNH endonuclease [Chitinophaga sp. SYP-B3965]MRG44100.1 hypothetical protein [Chitinophaga sp. SYP-B3965]
MNCYNCGVILNRKNRSVEHIINASIGGFKKGYNLLCQTCNKEFGKTIDRELVKQLGVFGRLLNIPLDRGTHSGSVSSDKVIVNSIDYQRAIAKICLNYYLSKGYPKQYCDRVRAFVKGESVAEDILHDYLPLNEEPSDNEVSHIVHLHGSKDTGVLYAYIELFNMQNKIIIFSMDYTGDDIDVTYCRDVVRNVELPRKMDFKLSRNDLEGLKDVVVSNFRYERLMKIIDPNIIL